MQIVVNRMSFVEGVSSIRKIIPSKTTLPAVNGVQISVKEPNVLELVGTDMMKNIKVECPCKSEGSGEVLLNCEKLLMMVSAMAGGEVTITTSGEGDSRVLVTDGKSKYNITSMAGEVLPAVFGNERKFCTIDCVALKDAIGQTIFASEGQDLNRPDAFPGVFFELRDNGTINCVATDRKKLAVCTVGVDDYEFGSDRENDTFYLSPASAQSVRGFCKEGKCVISRFKKMVTFKFNGIEYNTTLLNKEYPNYMAVVDGVAVTENKLQITASELSGIVRRATVVAMDAADNAVKLSFTDNRLVVSSRSDEYGESEEETLCSYSGEPITVTVNSVYFCEMLKSFAQNDVVAFFKEPFAPIRFVSGNAVVVFMPLRVG